MRRPGGPELENVERLKHSAALSSVLASGALTLAKLAVGLLSGSLALLSEAVHGAVDTGATLITYFAVRVSGKPADEDHHFGHEKIEAVAALFEVFLLIDVALVVVVEAVRRLRSGHADVDLTPWVFGVLALSMTVDVVRWRALRGIAAKTGSDALAADAVHFFSDLVGSAIVLMGLIAYAAGWKDADAFASFGVAGFIATAAVTLARRTVDTLLDKAPEGLAPRLREIAATVPGVAQVGTVRLRRLGGRVVGDMDVVVSRTLPAERITEIRRDVAAACSEADVAVEVFATTQSLDDETILERVLLVAARRRLPIHHVTVQHICGRTSVSFDLEIDGSLSHGAAHEIATALEAAVQGEIGTDVEVESHIEPMSVAELQGQDEPPARVQGIAEALAVAADQIGAVYDIHQVRARRTLEGLVVNYHCRVDPDLTVSNAHARVDAMEHAVRLALPDIIRLVGHAEPPRKVDVQDANKLRMF